MKTRKMAAFTFAGVLASGCVHAALQDAVIFDNGVTAFNSYTVSQPSAEQLVWDDFIFDAPTTITGIQWRGTYSTYSPLEDNFYIEIYVDNNGMPDTNALYSLSFGNNVNRSVLIPHNQTYIFNYSVAVSSINLSAGAYWLSIYDDFANDDPQRRWCWINQTNPSTGNEVIKNTLTGFSDHYALGTDFTLTGSVTSVPEPENYTMMLAGLGILGVAALRMKTRYM